MCASRSERSPRDRRLGLRQEHARDRDPVPGTGAAAQRRARAARGTRQARGRGRRRQDHRDRPEPDRPDAALEPGHVHGLFGPIRELFAGVPESRVRGYGPGRFSFNVKGGRCENCKGDGILKIEMQFLPDVYVTCEVCGGNRYNRETLEIHYRGHSVAEVLEMTVAEALELFERGAADPQQAPDAGRRRPRLHPPRPAGHDALRRRSAAGQARTELSRRATGKTLYILDEPTTGLHFADVEKLLAGPAPAGRPGNTVFVIEHNLDVIKTADWVIDLGPEGGARGGRIVAQGTPEQVARAHRARPQANTSRESWPASRSCRSAT